MKQNPKRRVKKREHSIDPVNVLAKKNKEREISAADHRLLGQQLDLFSISEEVGVGLVLWHPNGTIVRNLIRDYWEKEHLQNGYQLVCTPHIARRELWKTSGHLDYYEQSMYVFEKDGEGLVVKPMNCPFHIAIYKAKPRSYRELPIRYAEWGTVYRYERSGTLQGLLRVRGFTQDDAHIFCTPEQVKQEILTLLDFTRRIMRKFGFEEYRVHLSTRDPEHPEKYMGSDEEWQRAQNALAEALLEKRIDYREMPSEAVFYGPKIDMNIVDAVGREWQCTTLQFDFNLPKRFNVTYTGADNKEHEVVMIHRALLGAIERFFGILLEHCSGNLPTWLAPVQALVIPVSDYCLEYAESVRRKLVTYGIRAELDDSTSTVSYKIRNAELQKVPYMAIIGKHEAETGRIAVRRHGTGNLGSLTIEELARHVRKRDKR
ncbi:threonine--tRNA ligase [Candidatus Bathyarchaeota archaeon]|nr:threonine--tRNA ligase [Candidatus Bathyarchaeota archaeon]